MIAVIQTFVYPNAHNEHLVWTAILLLLLTRGPGVFSLDYLIGQYMKKRSRRLDR
jgi:putative oxidoreductase